MRAIGHWLECVFTFCAAKYFGNHVLSLSLINLIISQLLLWYWIIIIIIIITTTTTTTKWMNKRRKSIRLDTTGWVRWSTWNYSRNFNLTKRTKSICTTQHSPVKLDPQTPLGFCHTNRSPNLGQSTRPYNNQQKKQTGRIVDLAVLTDITVKLKKKKWIEG